MSKLKFVWTCTLILQICVEASVNAFLGSHVKSPVIFVPREESILSAIEGSGDLNPSWQHMYLVFHCLGSVTKVPIFFQNFEFFFSCKVLVEETLNEQRAVCMLGADRQESEMA